MSLTPKPQLRPLMLSLWFVWIALALPHGAAAHDPVFIDQGVDPFGITPEGARAKPSFADLDGDGDLDAFIGHGSGDTWFFENTGSATSPTFAAGIDNPFLLSNVISRSAPSFADLDGDGDLDALIGNEDGNIWFLPNTGSATSPEFPVRIINPFGLADVGTGANPSFVDIDGDGDLDAFIGNQAGDTRFFENTGSATSPAFATGVDDPALTPLPAGNSAPSFADLDRDGDLDAFIGSGQGHTKFFENIGSPTSRAFAPGINNPFGLADVGGVSAPSFADLDGDGDLDAFVANSGGRTRLFEDTRKLPNPIFAGTIANPFGLARVGDGEPGDDPHPWWYSFPSFADIDRDGDPDAYLGSATHDTHFQENIGSATNPDFLTLGGHGQHVFQSSYLFSTPTFADIDRDGDLDAFIGHSGGGIRFYENSGTATNRVFPSGAGTINPFGLAYVGSTSVPSFADIDGDGDLDALIGNEVGHTWFFENTGTATSPAFAAGIDNPFGLADVGTKALPRFADLDRDGDLDAFIGNSDGSIRFFENTGTAISPAFVLGDLDPFGLANVGAGRAAPAFADIDGDGDLDAFIGEVEANTIFFENVTLSLSPQVNTYTAGLQSIPEVAMDAAGDFVVVWTSQGSAGTDGFYESIQGRRFVAGGFAADFDFQVNTYTRNEQNHPSVAMDADGDFVVVWDSEGSPGTDSSESSIQGQRFAADGSPAGGEFQVNTYTTDGQSHPSVAMDADGDFVVVWKSDGSSGTDQSADSMQGQRYAADGSPVGGEFQVNTYTTNNQWRPSVAMDADGDFVVVWESAGSSGTDGSDDSIQGQLFAADGSPVGGELQVNTYTTDGQTHPWVAIDADGDFIIVWTSRGSPCTDQSTCAPLEDGCESIQGQRYTADGSPVGGQLQVNTYTTDEQSDPSVAMDADGDFVAVWQSDGSAGDDSSSHSIQKSLEPLSAPGFAKAFSPDAIAIGAASTLTFTIDASASLGETDGLAFTDDLPPGVVVAAAPNPSQTCSGGTLTAAAGATSISYSGGTVAAGASCTVSVDVTSAAAGSYDNTCGAIAGAGCTGQTASDTLVVLAPPGFAKAFSPDNIAIGGTSTLTFTIDNSANAAGLTGLAFTDTLPVNVVVDTPAVTTDGCSGSLTATAGAGTITYTGGSVASSSTCTVSVDVTSSTAGDHVNTSGALTSIAGDSGTAMATLTVNPAFGVDVAAQSPDSDQEIGTSADYTFRVTNTGANADTYDLAGSGLYFDTLSTATTAMLSQAAFEDVTVTAVVPCGATLGVAEALSLSATSQTMGAVMDSDSLDVTPFDVNTGSGGGYFFANSLAVCAASMPAFDWIDISATGTDVVAALDDDNLIGPVSIGFSFTFFGNTYTDLYISSNGWISFDGSDPGTVANRDNTTLPAPSLPNDLIAVFWDDMDPDDPDPGATHVYHGAGPGGSKVVTFERLPQLGADADGWITTQVVLYPDGNVKIQNLDHGPSIDLAGATVGIENSGGTLGLEYHLDGVGGVLFSSPLAVTFGVDDSSLPVRLQSFSIE